MGRAMRRNVQDQVDVEDQGTVDLRCALDSVRSQRQTEMREGTSQLWGTVSPALDKHGIWQRGGHCGRAWDQRPLGFPAVLVGGGHKLQE